MTSSSKEYENSFKPYAEARGVPIIRDESHELLSEIVKDCKPRHILEIGTAVGYSGITMLEASNADLVTIEKLEEMAIEAQKNFEKAGLLSRVKIINNDCSLGLIDLMLDENNLEKFDFIFLDGPKAQYLNMLPSLLSLLAPNGTLVADNVLFRGYVENPKLSPRRFRTIWQRLQKFIDYVENSGDFYDVKLHRIDDGVLVAKKRNNKG